MVLPYGSVMLIMVLLNVALMLAMPLGTFFFTFLRPLDLAFPGFGTCRSPFDYLPAAWRCFFLMPTCGLGPLRVSALVWVLCRGRRSARPGPACPLAGRPPRC